MDQAARALALGTDRLAHAGQRNNHYGCPTIRKAGPRYPVVKATGQVVRPERRRLGGWRLKRGAADGRLTRGAAGRLKRGAAGGG